MLKIYCDGACSGNPGPGAWGYVVFENGVQIAHAYGIETDTTNNRMELVATIKALEGFNDCNIIVDSRYVKDGITNWIIKWKKNGWKTASGKVKNVDLWEQLDELCASRNIKWDWEKGHANNTHDCVDILVRSAVLK
jgi:ribonuclease HI